MNEARRGWLLGALLVLAGCDAAAPAPGLTIDRVLGTPDASDGYARALGPRRFEFPADHGSHPDFRHEWWYFTGQLRDARGQQYGFQLTFFRFAIAAVDQPSASAWRTRQIWLAHFALSDLGTARFHAFERSARAALDLAGTARSPIAVWVRDWRAELADPVGGGWRLSATEGDAALSLALRPRKAPVFPGDAGWSRKGEAAGNASYYYAVSRLDAVGALEIDGRRVDVTGSAWLDREWGTSALAPDQAGWDWFALQLDDGSELTYYQLRRRDGSADPFSQGLLIAADGTSQPLRPAARAARDHADTATRNRRDRAGRSPKAASSDPHLASGRRGSDDDLRNGARVELAVTRHWQSPRTHLRYPAGWRIDVPGAALTLEVSPRLAGQEWNGTFRYWEGAVTVRGTRGGAPIGGRGYVELTGYDR